MAPASKTKRSKAIFWPLCVAQFSFPWFTVSFNAWVTQALSTFLTDVCSQPFYNSSSWFHSLQSPFDQWKLCLYLWYNKNSAWFLLWYVSFTRRKQIVEQDVLLPPHRSPVETLFQLWCWWHLSTAWLMLLLWETIMSVVGSHTLLNKNYAVHL